MQFETLEPRALFTVTGLTATYFDDINFAGKTTTRVDHAVSFNWQTNKPASGIHNESYSVRWTTRLKSVTSESYRLFLVSESPVRLWIGDTLVVDGWAKHSTPKSYKGSYNFTANQRYNVQIELAHNTGPASVSFQWQSDTLAKQTVPSRLMAPTDATLQAKVNHALAFARDRVSATLDSYPAPAAAGYPQTTDSSGKWKFVASSDWTSGDFGGEMWQLEKAFPNAGWSDNATLWTTPLSTESHDSGDNYSRLWNTFKPLYDKSRNPVFANVLIDAANAKDEQFSSKIDAFQTPGLVSNSGSKNANFGLLIDQTMDLELMYWASAYSGDARYADHATQHLQTVISKMVRSDGSVFQRYFYNGSTGAAIGGENYQGLSNTSTWSRGQAWAIDSFAHVAQITGNAQFIAAAKKVADYYVAHLPSDFVPYWDFAAPANSKSPRDSSAAAIAADGLLTLAKVTGDSTYHDDASNILNSLTSPTYLADGSSSRGVLLHGALNVPKGVSTDNSMVFGDYYFLDALNAYDA